MALNDRLSDENDDLREKLAAVEAENQMLRQAIKDGRSRLCSRDEFCECGCGQAAFRAIGDAISKWHTGRPAEPEKEVDWMRAISNRCRNHFQPLPLP